MRFKSRYFRAAKIGIQTAAHYLSRDFKYGNSSFSQCGEDILLKSLFEERVPSNYKGHYVDVGCHHPFRFSNTCIFHQVGWRGLNIDPTPSTIALFNKYRPDDINIEVAISTDKTPLNFNIFNEGAINSFDDTLAASREGKNGWVIKEKRTIIPMTLEEALDTYWPKNREIDFLDVDVEGFDYHVISSNNWEKYRPRFVLIEDDVPLSNTKDSNITKFLNDKNYNLVAATRLSRIFERA